METHKSKIGELYRNAFKEFSAEPSPDLWENLSKNPALNPVPKPGFFTVGRVIVASVALVTLVSVFFVTRMNNHETGRYLPKIESPVTNQQTIADQPIIAQKQAVTNSTEPTNTAKAVNTPPESVGGVKSENVTSMTRISEKAVIANKSPEQEIKVQKTYNISAVNSKQENTVTSNSSSQKSRIVNIPDENNNQGIIPDNTIKSIIDFTEDQMICKGDSVKLTASGGESYVWSTGAITEFITVSPSTTTTYTVSVTDFGGALTTHDIIVKVGDCSTISIPNAFTPNSDGMNDVFRASGQDLTGFSMIIFSRSSQIIFESHDISKGWDGLIKGKIAETGVYVYQIKYTDPIGKSHTVNGHLTLLR